MKKAWTEPEITVLGVNETEYWTQGSSQDGFIGQLTLIGPNGTASVSTTGFSGGGEYAPDVHNAAVEEAKRRVGLIP